MLHGMRNVGRLDEVLKDDCSLPVKTSSTRLVPRIVIVLKRFGPSSFSKSTMIFIEDVGGNYAVHNQLGNSCNAVSEEILGRKHSDKSIGSKVCLKVSAYLSKLQKLLFVRIYKVPQVLVLSFHKQVECHVNTPLLSDAFVIVLPSHLRILLHKNCV